MRDSEERKALKLKAIDLLRESVIIKEVCRQCGVADTTLMKWRAQLAPELLPERLRTKYRRIYSEWKASGTDSYAFASANRISHNTLYVAAEFCEGSAGMSAGESAAKPDSESEGEVVFYDGPLCAGSRGRLRERSVRGEEPPCPCLKPCISYSRPLTCRCPVTAAPRASAFPAAPSTLRCALLAGS